MGLQRSSPLSLPISIGAQSIPPRLVSPQQRSTGLVDAGLAGHSFDAVISEPALRAFALQESRNFRLLADTEHSHLPQFRRSRIGVAQTRHAAGFQSTQDAGFAGTECCPLSLLRGRWLQICSRLPAKKNRPDQDQPGRFLMFGRAPRPLDTGSESSGDYRRDVPSPAHHCINSKDTARKALGLFVNRRVILIVDD